MIIIYDYGVGNNVSIKNIINRIGLSAEITSEISQVEQASFCIIPGVGSFDPAMINLTNTDLITDLKNWIKSGKSFLGICLGLQLLFESSDEGKVPGLGILKGKIQKIPVVFNQRIPHMGWCQLLPTKKNTLLDLEELNNWVYFVHSYHAIPDDNNIIAAKVNYGSEKLTAMIENDNLLACQFHPEKSGKTGEKLLRRWLSNIQ